MNFKLNPATANAVEGEGHARDENPAGPKGHVDFTGFFGTTEVVP
jgi:hypothetical protein